VEDIHAGLRLMNRFLCIQRTLSLGLLVGSWLACGCGSSDKAMTPGALADSGGNRAQTAGGGAQADGSVAVGTSAGSLPGTGANGESAGSPQFRKFRSGDLGERTA
jgi:hypothetical protein